MPDPVTKYGNSLNFRFINNTLCWVILGDREGTFQGACGDVQVDPPIPDSAKTRIDNVAPPPGCERGDVVSIEYNPSGIVAPLAPVAPVDEIKKLLLELVLAVKDHDDIAGRRRGK